jgi:retron-type reverse transcriptase
MFTEHSIKDESFGQRWKTIDWERIQDKADSMQRDISRASLEGDLARLELAKAAFLSSYEARALAVRHVTDSSSTGNPGLGEAWITDEDKGRAVSILTVHDYHSEPYLTFRIHEEKSNKERMISLATFFDRAIHDMYRMAMEPAIEPLLDKRLFSSREGRSLSDACMETVYLLSGPEAPMWVLRCDVKAFYSTIDHRWLKENTCMPEDVIAQILDPGFKSSPDSDTVHYHQGVPMGDRLSPVFANMILNGIGNGLQDPDDPLNGVTVRWVDDMIITARTEEDAKQFLGHVNAFLAERNMSLNTEKTYIANTRDGFEFLKFRFKRIYNSVEIFPTEQSLDDFRNGIAYVCSNFGGDERKLIKDINSKMRGFATKYRIADLTHVADDLDAFVRDSAISCIFDLTHVSKSDIEKRLTSGHDIEVDGIRLMTASSIERVPHPRVWLTANPYLDRDYFEERSRLLAKTKIVKEKGLWDSRNGMCAVCGLPIQYDQERSIMTDIDGERGYIHTDCAEDTEYTRIRGHFSSMPDRNILGVPLGEVRNEPMKKVRKEQPSNPMPKANPNALPVVKFDSGRSSKFQSLTDHLASNRGQSLTMTMEEVESILGAELCESARKVAGHWQRKGYGLRNAVESAGWTLGEIDIDNEKVTFLHMAPRRNDRSPAESAYLRRQDRMFGAEDLKRRDEAIRIGRFGRFTRYLLDCDKDQLFLSFREIETILGKRLPDSATKRDLWGSRAPGKMLLAIEDGDYEKVSVNLTGKTLLIAKVYCEPDPTKGTVEGGKLKLKSLFTNGTV